MKAPSRRHRPRTHALRSAIASNRSNARHRWCSPTRCSGTPDQAGVPRGDVRRNPTWRRTVTAAVASIEAEIKVPRLGIGLFFERWRANAAEETVRVEDAATDVSEDEPKEAFESISMRRSNSGDGALSISLKRPMNELRLN